MHHGPQGPPFPQHQHMQGPQGPGQGPPQRGPPPGSMGGEFYFLLHNSVTRALSTTTTALSKYEIIFKRVFIKNSMLLCAEFQKDLIALRKITRIYRVNI